ncbi:efflux RND transporter periplasmic adaptor subunit [Ahniella affigens]|uniref:Efflux RND transporter periplasmic adaptor subunit n=1 Tax=Ahniella affigens TaxID=2021234 RepID=A0A2P1PS85_9GAMM|nr:efflux RND transporter periplasmic adaptor subunit [Ahniella affigens]AVP97698.1 efflux RND transporter periplasmic adaptor subunit [Ahniella affigens]
MTRDSSASRSNTAVDTFLGVTPKSRWQRWRKWLVLAFVVLLALVVANVLFGGKQTETRLATAKIERGEMRVTVTATGNLEPTNQVTVGSEVSGLVRQVLVDVNDSVTLDQPLAILDTTRLEDAIRRSDASLGAAKAGVQQADATVVETKASLDRLDRIFEKSGGTIPSQADLDVARAAYRRALANQASAKANVVSAEAQLSSDRTNLTRATLRSPVNGVVLARNAEPGQTVAASFSAPELFVIAEDLSSMQAKVKVDEADVGQVREGMPASFTVDAWPGKVFPATVRRVDFGANSTTQTTGAATTSTVVSYTAVLDVENPKGLLRPGMTATATLVTSVEQDALLVPNAALRYTPTAGGTQTSNRGGTALMAFPRMQRPDSQREVAIGRGAKRTLYLLGKTGKAEPIEVTVGSSDGSRTIVESDTLQAGMDVVTGEMASQ